MDKMNEFSKLFKKVGGFSLIKDYIKSNVFFLAVSQFLLLGSSKKALEIVRLSTQLKIQKRLEKRYINILRNFQNEIVINQESKSNKTVWICWLQGIENAPELVKKCYQSICKHLNDWNIIVITCENLADYTEFPEYIIEKWQNGIISNTHFSDLLRLELLTRHGGLWIDSTVLCTGKVPEYITESELFLFQCLKPGLDGHCILGSNWLIYSKSNNIVLLAVKKLLLDYWEKNNHLVDYFIFHHFMSITLRYFDKEWNKIPKVPNDLPHVLLLQLFDEYDDNKYNHIKQFTSFHKLSYKQDKSDMEKKNTFYDVIINQNKY